MKLLLVRHAEPFMSGDTPGATWPLTEKGRNEARAMGTHLANWPLDAIWTSPERRARETAALAFPSTVADVRSQLSEVRKPWYTSSDEHAGAVVRYLRGRAVAGWEPRDAVITRIAQLKFGIESFESVALVTHGLFITVWLDHEIGLDDPFAFWFNLQMPDAWAFDLDEKSHGRIAWP